MNARKSILGTPYNKAIWICNKAMCHPSLRSLFLPKRIGRNLRTLRESQHLRDWHLSRNIEFFLWPNCLSSLQLTFFGGQKILPLRHPYLAIVCCRKIFSQKLCQRALLVSAPQTVQTLTKLYQGKQGNQRICWRTPRWPGGTQVTDETLRQATHVDRLEHPKAKQQGREFSSKTF